MPAGRRHSRVHHRGDGALEDGALGGATVLGVVVGALDVVEVGADVDGAAVLRAGLEARKLDSSASATLILSEALS